MNEKSPGIALDRERNPGHLRRLDEPNSTKSSLEASLPSPG